jgi:hypothetical protein
MKSSQQKQLFTYLTIGVGIIAVSVIAWLVSSKEQNVVIQSTSSITSNSVFSTLPVTSSLSTTSVSSLSNITVISSVPPASTQPVTGKTGTFTSDVSYRVPRGTTTVKFSLTLDGGKVTGASATMISGDRESRDYISQYNSGFLKAIKDKNLSDISEVYISGASLTSNAFDNALQTIKTQ